MTGRINNGLKKIIFPLLVLMISCNSSVLYTDTAVMPGKTWSLSNVPAFTVPVKDTVSTSDISFNIRTGSDYPFRNIWLFVTAVSPDGKILTDTLEYELADEKGSWFGKGFGDIHELTLPYKQNVFFPLKGSYQFKIQHGMRSGDLTGVYDFALRVEKHRSKQ